MYENQLLATMTQMSATLDAIRLELDALVGLLDVRLRPPPPATAEAPPASRTGSPPKGFRGREREEDV